MERVDMYVHFVDEQQTCELANLIQLNRLQRFEKVYQLFFLQTWELK